MYSAKDRHMGAWLKSYFKGRNLKKKSKWPFLLFPGPWETTIYEKKHEAKIS